MKELLKTTFTSTVEVNKYDAETYIAILESDYRIWSDFNTETGMARAAMAKYHLEMAQRLFGIPVNLTDPKTQKEIEAANV